MARHILAIDQGTTGSTALVMSTDGATLGRANREFSQHFPQPGWVEHDPAEIWQSVVQATEDALRAAGVRGGDIAAIGITNQRETTVLWDRRTGQPIHRAIVWQDRRTADRCVELRAAGHEQTVGRHTGLVLDPYFSGTKIAWILDHVDGARQRADRGELAFGTIDSHLVCARYPKAPPEPSFTSLLLLSCGRPSPARFASLREAANFQPARKLPRQTIAWKSDWNESAAAAAGRGW